MTYQHTKSAKLTVLSPRQSNKGGGGGECAEGAGTPNGRGCRGEGGRVGGGEKADGSAPPRIRAAVLRT
jgi:hypothetical protein